MQAARIDPDPACESYQGPGGWLPVPLPSYLVPAPREGVTVCPKPRGGAWQSPLGSCCSNSHAQSCWEAKWVPWGGGSGGLRWGAHLEASPRDSLLPLNPFPICGCFFLTPHHILPPSPPRGLGACLVPTEELWEEAEPTCAERFPPPRTSGCGQPLLNQAVVPSQPLAEGIGAAAELGEPQKGQRPRDANWGSGLAHFTLASIHAGRPEAWGWRRGQLSGWSPLIFVPIFLQQSTN